jgi:hypothetical protein
MDAILAVSAAKYIQYVVTSIFRGLEKNGFLVIKSRLEAKKNSKSAKKVLSEIHSDFLNAFLNFKVNEELIWAWLTGEKADLRELKKIGIKNRIDSPTIALRILHDFSRILKVTGYAGLLLCIDETEEVALSGDRKLVEILTMLKKILEQSKSEMSNSPEETVPISFCLGFTPETFRLITGEEGEFAKTQLKRTGGAGLQTFVRRMSMEARFDLQGFSKKVATEFITMILNKARKKPAASPSPFAPDAIGYINSLSVGTPATIIDHCRVSLREADRTKVKTITWKHCERWLREKGVKPAGTPETVEVEAG